MAHIGNQSTMSEDQQNTVNNRNRKDKTLNIVTFKRELILRNEK